jgi:epoxyqueuosine reductase QueG
MTSFTEEIKKKALKAGFTSVGITSPESMRDLPYGWVADVKKLKPPEEIMPGTRSVVLLVFNGKDRAFSLQIDSPEWKGYGLHLPEEEPEGFYVSYQVTMNKAWPLVSLLKESGHQAQLTTSIPMKTAAIQCGLGCQGKNTLFVHPEVGPRAMLMAILTSATLEIDEPYEGDLCGECDLCIRACPSKALNPYNINIKRCLAYAAENLEGVGIPEDVKELEKKLIVRPTPNSFIECTTCIFSCPIGR